MIDRRPASGGGSCARCGRSLDLAAQKREGVWYCSSACAEGHAAAAPRPPRVPEPWLYARPRRFFGPRAPKELRRAQPPPGRGRPQGESRSSTEK